MYRMRMVALLERDVLTRSVVLAAVVFLLVYSLHPGRFACTYTFIKRLDIISELEPSEHIMNLYKEGSKELCPAVLVDGDDTLHYPNLSLSDVDMKILAVKLKVNLGGWWKPHDCVSRFQVAIVIPFRNRSSQLRIFAAYMHPFLQKQKLDYRIFVVEQSEKADFNRAKLFNVGYTEAMKLFPYPCFVFHDVDLIPQKLSNMYACTHQPRHLSSSLNTFRYNLPYKELFGGAVAILQKQFELVNGFSNVFYGWGGEDDDFQGRIANRGLQICRFDPSVARYLMLTHAKEAPSENRFANLRAGRERFATDGLNTLQYSLITTTNESLFTRFLVEL